MKVLPVVTDPIRLAKHLADAHDMDYDTVNMLTGDDMRRLHRDLHQRWCEHLHVDRA